MAAAELSDWPAKHGPQSEALDWRRATRRRLALRNRRVSISISVSPSDARNASSPLIGVNIGSIPCAAFAEASSSGTLSPPSGTCAISTQRFSQFTLGDGVSFAVGISDIASRHFGSGLFGPAGSR